ncbi:MAG: hypothetical protein ACM3X6_13385 [Patescibacteria group bacterium]
MNNPAKRAKTFFAMEESMAAIKTEGDKVYLEGVKRISWDTGEMCEFTSALVAALGCLGEDVSYHYCDGYVGALPSGSRSIPAHRTLGTNGIRNIAADQYEPINRAMKAVGHE